MKKALIIILALALVMGLSAPALAAEDEYRQTELYFYYDALEPVYYVTIPDAITLDFGENYLTIGVDGTENLGGKAVAIYYDSSTLNMSQEPGYALYVSALVSESTDEYGDPEYAILYILSDSDGEAFGETHLDEEDEYPFYMQFIEQGTELANFYGDGEDYLILTIEDSMKMFYSFAPNIAYSGYIIFGIGLR